MKKIILFAIIISLLIPAITMAGKKHNENDVLSGMLKELKGQFLEGDFNMGGIIIDEFISKEDIESIGDEIKTKLEIVGEKLDLDRDITDLEGQYYFEEIIFEDGYNQMSIYGYDMDNNPITIMISSYLISEYGNGETTLFINLIKGSQNFSINGIIEKIENIFMKFGKPVEITTCIIGSIKGKLEEDSLERNVIKAMKKYKVKTVEEYKDSTILSYTGFTPLIDSFIFSGNKKVNLNLAIRYSEYEDMTYIWIGTPIITTGY